MKARILRALQSAMLSVCLFIAVVMSAPVHGQTVTLYVHGDVGLAIQEHPRCCNPPACDQCDATCSGELCAELLCSSWEHPCRYLQDALARARVILDDPNTEPGTIVRIWVAATAPNNPYRPHMCSEFHAMLSAEPPVNPASWTQHGCTGGSFHLQNNVQILGGFPSDSANEQKYGFGGAKEEHRNWEEHVTVLSGDLDGNSIFRLYCDDGRVFENGVLTVTARCFVRPVVRRQPQMLKGIRREMQTHVTAFKATKWALLDSNQ